MDMDEATARSWLQINLDDPSDAHVAGAIRWALGRVAELERQRGRDAEDLAMYERWAKDSPVKEVDCSCGVRHSVRIADADLNTSTGTDWGVRWTTNDEVANDVEHDHRAADGGEQYARRVHAQYPRQTELVACTRGPWRVAT